MLTKRLFFKTLSPSQERILLSLARYKFLTAGQMLRLGIMTDRANLNKQISELRYWKNPLVGSVTFGVNPKFWKLESIHHLTSHGAALIKERLSPTAPVRFPKANTVLFAQDYFHRKNTIDIHIVIQERAFNNNVELLFFLVYFDKLSTGKSKGFRAETYIPFWENEYLIADAICMLQTQNRKELYAIEVFNGMNVQRVHQSLLQHLMALKDGQPSKLFELDYGSRVLCVFELDSCKIQVMKRLCDDEHFAFAKDYFLFKTLDEIKENVFDGWQLFDDEIVKLF